MDVKKTLKIKAGTCKRLVKEYVSYTKEETKQRERIEKLKSNGGDDSDVRKQEEVLAETLAMFPDCRRRMEAAQQDMEKFIEENGEDAVDSKELEEAKTSLSELEAFLTANGSSSSS